MALSRRWKTNQFSAQPAISELANSSTPVKAAYSAVGPSSVSDVQHVLGRVLADQRLRRASHHDSACAPSTSGAHSARLPKMPAACERIRCTTSSTKASTVLSLRHVVEPLRHRRRRHRRLLGGHRAVQQHDDHEAQRIVGAGPEAVPEGRQAQRQHAELQQRGAGQHRAADGRAPEHVAVLVAVARDVVLAGLGAALGHLARQLRIVARQQRAHAAALAPACAPATASGAAAFLRRRGRQHAVEQLLDAPHARAQLVGLVDDVHRDAELLEVLADAVHRRRGSCRAAARR